MVKYYCNTCNMEVGKDERMTVQVMKPDGSKPPASHYCPDCWRDINSYLSLLRKNASRKRVEEKVVKTTELVDPSEVSSNDLRRNNSLLKVAASTTMQSEDKKDESVAVRANTIEQNNCEVKLACQTHTLAITAEEKKQEDVKEEHDEDISTAGMSREATILHLREDIDFIVKDGRFLTDKTRDYIISKYQDGYSKSVIADALKIPATSVMNVINRYADKESDQYE